MADILGLPGEEIPGMLVSNFEVIKQNGCRRSRTWTSSSPGYRELTTFARLFWSGRGTRSCALSAPAHHAHAHRVGDEDRIVPMQQHRLWQKFLPKADIRIINGAGHLVLDEKPEAAIAVGNFLAA